MLSAVQAPSSGSLLSVLFLYVATRLRIRRSASPEGVGEADAEAEATGCARARLAEAARSKKWKKRSMVVCRLVRRKKEGFEQVCVESKTTAWLGLGNIFSINTMSATATATASTPVPATIEQ